MRVAPVHFRPPQRRPFAALPPVRIVDWGIELCYAIAVRHCAPPIVGGYIHCPPTCMHKVPEQIQEIKEVMAALSGPLEPRRMKAAVTGLADINVESDARGQALEEIGASLRDEGIAEVVLDRHGNATYGERMIEFDIEDGSLYVLLQPEPLVTQILDGRVVPFPDLSRHPRAVKIKIG